MTVRWLTDDYDLFYDASDIFEHAAEGKMWTDRWTVGGNRSVQVGDTVFILTPDASVQARGRVVAADPDDQLRTEPDAADLSVAYCSDPYELDEIDGVQPLWVRIEVDSAVEVDHELSLAWLATQPGGGRLTGADVTSGEAVDEASAPVLIHHWDELVDRLQPDGLGTRVG